MYPMDFEEFLLANNISESIIDEIKESFISKKVVPESLNNLLLKIKGSRLIPTTLFLRRIYENKKRNI